jgi:hypothetical protein
MENSIKSGFETSTQNIETDGNYSEETLVTRDFGNDPNGNMFGQDAVIQTNVPMDCPSNFPNLGTETSFGSNPDGEMFGAPAPDKLGLVSQSEGWKSVSETDDVRSFDSLTLSHDAEEGTRGPILAGREF